MQLKSMMKPGVRPRNRTVPVRIAIHASTAIAKTMIVQEDMEEPGRDPSVPGSASVAIFSTNRSGCVALDLLKEDLAQLLVTIAVIPSDDK